MRIYTKIIFVLVATISFVGCTKDEDTVLFEGQKFLLEENFDNTSASNIPINQVGWISYAEQGTKLWQQKSFSGDGYALFSSFGSGQPTNVSWLISPAINMDSQNGEKLFFQSCQDGFIRSRENSLELYVSTDYDGITFTNASWERIDFNAPTPDTTRFIYLDSGIIDLSKYKGNLRFAFKIKGTTALTGGYQLDKIKVFY
jgi:hypothetical protein